jgi:hypothetical protein
MPALSDGDQEATDHGNLMDLEVVEVEREAVEGAEGQDDQLAGEMAKATQPTSASEQQVEELIAEEHAEAQDSVT